MLYKCILISYIRSLLTLDMIVEPVDHVPVVYLSLE